MHTDARPASATRATGGGCAEVGGLCPEQGITQPGGHGGWHSVLLWPLGPYPENSRSYIISRKNPHVPAMAVCCQELGYLAELHSLVVPQYLHLKHGKNNTLLRGKQVVVTVRAVGTCRAFGVVSNAQEMFKDMREVSKD